MGLSASAELVASKNDGGGGDNWSYKMCKAAVRSLPPTNQHLVFYRPDALPVPQPTVSEHWRKNVLESVTVNSVYGSLGPFSYNLQAQRVLSLCSLSTHRHICTGCRNDDAMWCTAYVERWSAQTMTSSLTLMCYVVRLSLLTTENCMFTCVYRLVIVFEWLAVLCSVVQLWTVHYSLLNW